MSEDIRYYMGRHKIRILEKAKNKCLIEHLEYGKVGMEGLYKLVQLWERDIVPMRCCHRNKKEKRVE